MQFSKQHPQHGIQWMGTQQLLYKTEPEDELSVKGLEWGSYTHGFCSH